MSAIERDSVVWDRKVACEAPWVGFKLMANQLALLPRLADELIERNAHVICLTRDLLENHVSRIVAKKRGIYHSTEELPPVCIDLDPDSTVRSIRKVAREFDMAQRWLEKCPRITVRYEKLFHHDSQIAEMTRILEFLGLSIDRMGSMPKLKKLVKQPIRDVVGNYDQVVALLSDEEHRYS